MGKWKHIGGGCGFGTVEHPCDDEYENSETGERRSVYSAPEDHFKMPQEVATIEELAERHGAVLTRVDNCDFMGIAEK